MILRRSPNTCDYKFARALGPVLQNSRWTMDDAPQAVNRLDVEQFGLSLALDLRVDRPKDAVVRSLPRSLPFKPGETLLDLGSGAGLFSLIGLQQGCSVIATDVLQEALDLTRANARLNNLSVGRLQTRLGSLFDAVGTDQKFDIIVSNLPQTPCGSHLPMTPAFCDSKWGGDDGLKYIAPALRQGYERLRPGGRLLMLQIGWLPWRRIDSLVAELGGVPSVIATGWRPFQWEEYDGYASGLSDYLRKRIADGEAEAVRKDETCNAFPFRWHITCRPEGAEDGLHST